MKPIKTWILAAGIVLAVALGWVGLGSRRPALQPEAATSGAPVPPPGSVHGAPGQPVGRLATPGKSISGKVVKVLQVTDYTYLRIATAPSTEVWAAVRHADVAAGAQVRVMNAMLMTNFHSNTLGRDFEQIYFGDLMGAAAAGSAASSHLAGPHGSGGGDAADKVAIDKVEAIGGDDGRTVARVFAERSELSGKQVRVRAVVVKAISGVLDRTWLHVRDGSGSAERGDNDLVVTTRGTAEVGQTVVVKGRVSVDKDFGAGYRYRVLIEDADVEVEQ